MAGCRSMIAAAFMLALATAPALAANEGQADPGLLLGALDTYPSEAAAVRACRQDRVVWADRYSGFFYDRGDAKYGATPDGSYACLSGAKQARYWSTDPREAMDGHPGRNFPFDRLFFGS